jgi:hypothetical protein
MIKAAAAKFRQLSAKMPARQRSDDAACGRNSLRCPPEAWQNRNLSRAGGFKGIIGGYAWAAGFVPPEREMSVTFRPFTRIQFSKKSPSNVLGECMGRFF